MNVEGTVADRLLALEQTLIEELDCLTFDNPPVFCIYNPLKYAKETHTMYVRKYCHDYIDVIFIGMNPGPFGMSQNGVPFGECKLVRDFLKIEGNVEKPEYEHPKRPIFGLNCPTSEVSGARFWSLISTLTKGDPDVFFKNCYVHNYCPLAFMDFKGKNITPASMNKKTVSALEELCDKNLCETVKLLKSTTIVGIGKYAAARATKALASVIPEVKVCSIMHPSPANPAANRTAPNWGEIVKEQLNQLDILNLIC